MAPVLRSQTSPTVDALVGELRAIKSMVDLAIEHNDPEMILNGWTELPDHKRYSQYVRGYLDELEVGALQLDFKTFFIWLKCTEDEIRLESVSRHDMELDLEWTKTGQPEIGTPGGWAPLAEPWSPSMQGLWQASLGPLEQYEFNYTESMRSRFDATIAALYRVFV